MRFLKLLLTVLTVSFVTIAYAQPGFDDDVEDVPSGGGPFFDDDVNDVPLDGGASLLVGAAAIYGAKKWRKRKGAENEENEKNRLM